MLARDLGILIVAALAAFLALQGKESFVSQRKFVIDIDPSHWKNHHTPADHEKIPQPIVTDLDGDGFNELIVVTREPKIIIYDTTKSLSKLKPGKKNHDPMALHLLIKAESTLLSKAKVRSARQPVAFNVGYLDAEDKHKHIVVLTHDWTVLCYDHNLKLKWEQHPIRKKMADVYHKEAAVIITTTKVRGNDHGLVVVGASHELSDYNRYFKHTPKVDRKTHRIQTAHRDKVRSDRRDRRVRKHLIQAILRGQSRNHDALVKDAASRESRIQFNQERKLEKLRHFSYFAMEGRTGALRWKQGSSDWSLHDQTQHTMVPQHNYKLDFHTESKHAGEVDWRQYRVSMLGSLPHKWDRREDTSFEVAHYSKKRLSSVAEDAARTEALHHREVGLFESAPLPSSKGRDINVDSTAKEADSKHKNNVLVAHTHNGIEVIHIFTGRTLCQLPLPSHTLNADINHDGVIDRVESIITADGETVMHESGHEAMGNPPNCYGWVVTGTPPTHALFNKTICTGSWNSMSVMLSKMQRQTRRLTRGASENQDEEDEAPYELHTSTPALVARPSGRVISRSMQMHGLVFAVSDGTVTSLTPSGHSNWQVMTSAWWTTPALVYETQDSDRTAREEEKHLIEIEPYPQVLAFRTRTDRRDENVLVIGSHSGALLGSDGTILTHLSLPDVPVAPAIIADFDSDGFNDVIVVTRTGYHGFVMTGRANHLLTFLLGSLLTLLGAMFLIQITASSSDGKGRPSTASSASRSSSSSSTSAFSASSRRVKKERATD